MSSLLFIKPMPLAEWKGLDGMGSADVTQIDISNSIYGEGIGMQASASCSLSKIHPKLNIGTLSQTISSEKHTN